MAIIEVSDLGYTYRGPTRSAVAGLCFEIGAGEIFGLLGPSGAGKTTTQNVLIGLLKGYEGRVRVMDRDLGDWRSDYYERVGVSFEFPNHYLKLTARENLEYFRSLFHDETEAAEEVIALVGLEADIDTRVSDYSKGMKNRLSVARSLLNRPRLWFLDEPTAGLDPINARKIREIVKARRDGGTTVFLTTHDMTVADELCDRVGFIVDGKLTIVDEPKSLKRQYGTRSVVVEFETADGSRSSTFSLDGLADNGEFHATLREHRVETIHSQETTLEQVFLEVTGKRLS